VTTADGWTITFDKLLVSIGGADLSGADCNEYSSTDYERILNLMLPGPQKVNELYGLGNCSLGYMLSGAYHDDVVIGQAVTQDDVRLMRRGPAAASDDSFDYVRPRTLHVEGRATNGQTNKTFRWGLAQRAEYKDCRVDGELSAPREFALRSEQKLSVNVTIDLAGLFDSRGWTTSPFAPILEGEVAIEPRFQAFADADLLFGNNDGEVTLEELGKVQIKQLRAGGRYAIPAASNILTLRDFVREQNVTRRLANQIDGAICLGLP
jgi:hypothetical protein